jgi:D-lyxose ketol-isomerase
MKRSEINRIIDESTAFFAAHGFSLPPFCCVSPDEWGQRCEEFAEVIGAGLGWDVTDFDLGDFKRTGIVLVTLRNGGTPAAKASGKTYCEKIIHMRKDQACPMHYHRKKTEDIINRGGGTLCFELHTASGDGRSFSPDGFGVWTDGMRRECRPGEILRLSAGQSLTLPPFLFHSFWAEADDALVGEVSTVNDDVADNVFFREVPRFMTIDEDEAPRYLLVHETARFLTGPGV